MACQVGRAARIPAMVVWSIALHFLPVRFRTVPLYVSLVDPYHQSSVAYIIFERATVRMTVVIKSGLGTWIHLVRLLRN